MANGKSDGSVIIETLINTDGFKKLHTELKNATSGMKDLGKTVAKTGAGLTAGFTVPIVALGTSMVESASDMEENLNKVDVAFGNSSESVKNWAETATEAFGLSKNQALEATSLFGDMATSMGVNQDAAADMAISLAGLAGDLASFKNIDIEQAMTALNGVFTGETESLKTLGVVMTETNLEEFANKIGVVYDEMSQAEKVQLRYAYVLEMTQNAQGDYARTSDGTANSMRTMEASIENLQAALGEHLLPIITPLIQGLTDLINKFGEMDPSAQKVIMIVLAVIAAIGPLATVIGGIITAVSTVIPIIGAVVGALNPITIVIGAIVAAIALLIANWDKVVAKFKEVDSYIQQVFAKDWTEVFGPVLGGVMNEFFDTLSEIWDGVKRIFNGIIDFIKNVFSGNWEEAWNSVVEIFGGIFDSIVAFVKNPINKIIQLINGMIAGIVLGINVIIEAMNGLSFDIPDWVPGIGGKTFGFDIQKFEAPKIPYLASGAVIPPNAPFMAMLGDQRHGTNIEAPLDTIKQAVREVIGSGGSRVLHNYLYLDSRLVYEEMIDEAKLDMSTTGRNPFDLQ